MNCSFDIRKPEEQPPENKWNIVIDFGVKLSHYHTEVHREPTDCKHRDNCKHLDGRLTFPRLVDVSMLIDAHWWLVLPKKPGDQEIQDCHDDKRNCIGDDDSHDHFRYVEKRRSLQRILVPLVNTVLYSTYFYGFVFVELSRTKHYSTQPNNDNGTQH